MMVIYLPVKLNSIGQTVFELESGNGHFDGQTKMDKQMDEKQTNEQSELHQHLAMMVIYLSVKFEFD